jgi:flagellar biosynthetic protein FlhB
MAEESGQEKSEEPTAKRLSDAREKGDVPRLDKECYGKGS